MSKPKKAHKEAPKKELLKLDIGCGERPREGYLGVDYIKTPAVKYQVDIRKTPWPFKNESVSDIYCQQFLEHLNGYHRVKFMNEVYRVLAPGGKAEIISPYWTSARSIQDPTHLWPPLAENSFLYFNETWLRQNHLTHMRIFPACEHSKDQSVSIECNFDFPYGYGVVPEFAQKNEETRTFATQHYVNVVNDVFVTLTKIPRLPKE